MSDKSIRASLIKEDGNRRFQAGDYHGAEALYSKAIVFDPSQHALYSNRAMARLKLQLWDSVVADCNECLNLNDQSIKAHYYLSQALIALHDYDQALEHATAAYELCVKTNDKSLARVTSQIKVCKTTRWDQQEKRRKRETSDLELEVLAMMERERDNALSEDPALRDDERQELRTQWERKLDTMRDIFEKSRAAHERTRKAPPDWAIDDISLEFMHDPVITKEGKSYERAHIMEHLKRKPTDPLSGQPLSESDLRRNINLKQALEEYLEENGWAADY